MVPLCEITKQTKETYLKAWTGDWDKTKYRRVVLLCKYGFTQLLVQYDIHLERLIYDRMHTGSS